MRAPGATPLHQPVPSAASGVALADQSLTVPAIEAAVANGAHTRKAAPSANNVLPGGRSGRGTGRMAVGLGVIDFGGMVRPLCLPYWLVWHRAPVPVGTPARDISSPPIVDTNCIHKND